MVHAGFSLCFSALKQAVKYSPRAEGLQKPPEQWVRVCRRSRLVASAFSFPSALPLQPLKPLWYLPAIWKFTEVCRCHSFHLLLREGGFRCWLGHYPQRRSVRVSPACLPSHGGGWSPRRALLPLPAPAVQLRHPPGPIWWKLHPATLLFMEACHGAWNQARQEPSASPECILVH